MKATIKTLLTKYEIRKTAAQKQEFQAWLQEIVTQYGYELTEHDYSKTGKNLIIGDMEASEMILSAHYDTPAHSIIPMTAFCSGWVRYLMGQLVITIPIIGAFLMLGYNVGYVIGSLASQINLTQFSITTVISILILLWFNQTVNGFANRHNANDNTSGVATLISILEDLPMEQRAKVCFIFFDEEEKGLRGSQAFLQAHKEMMEQKPLINFDCVGNGQHLIFSAKQAFCDSNHYQLLKDSANQACGTKRNLVIGTSKEYVQPSDNLFFKQSVGVGSVHHKPIIGYYMKDIHTSKDTTFDYENIEILSTTMLTFISKLGEVEVATVGT